MRPGSAPGPRRLGHPEMAFVRCWAEGLDLVAAWNRYLYLQGPGDARRARSELQRLLDVLRSLARAHGRADIAVLLRRDPEAIVDPGPAQPTLEEFAARQPADFYSQAELAHLYQEQVGHFDARSAGRRRQRLRERLVLAVQWLERAGAREPHPMDAVGAWLDERVAQRLGSAGIHRVGELVAWIARKGFHWHRGVPRLGARGAARIVRWIGDHAATLGTLPPTALRPASRLDAAGLVPAPHTGIVPLERFVAPQAVPDAAAGIDAVRAWLAQREAGSHTWRAYRKEAERLVLWALLQQGKPLRALDAQDAAAYRHFLAAPAPQWVGPRHARRCSADWRPFEGPLSDRSAATALVIVRGLFEWLLRNHHVASNPFAAAAASPAPAAPPLRALSPAHWGRVQEWMTRQAPSPALSRLRWVLWLGQCTGLRLSEMVAARRNWLCQTRSGDGAETWVLCVPGVGARRRELALPQAAVSALRAHLQARGLGADIACQAADTPLLARLDAQAPLSAGRLYEVLVSAFERCAADLQRLDPAAAERIREASTHWLRHTHGWHAMASGVPRGVLQARLGLRRPSSTALYLRAEGLGGQDGRPPEAFREA